MLLGRSITLAARRHRSFIPSINSTIIEKRHKSSKTESDVLKSHNGKQRSIRTSWFKQDQNEPFENDSSWLLDHLSCEFSTSNRIHSLSISCENVVRLIKFGIFTKQMVAQYCRYLARFARTAEPADKDHYAELCYSLLENILRNPQDAFAVNRSTLILDVACMTKTNCEKVFHFITKDKKIFDTLTVHERRSILRACYKVELWSIANKVLALWPEIHTEIYGPMIEAFIASAERYSAQSNSPQDEEDKKLLRQCVFENFFKLIEIGQQLRIPFVTEFETEFIESLRKFDITVVKKPPIKLSRRCTNCNNYLPENKVPLEELNASIKGLLNLKYDNHVLLNRGNFEMERFEKFLEKECLIDTQPIDIIIDGLNVGIKNNFKYTYGTRTVNDNFQKSFKRPSHENLAQVLINVILRAKILEKFKNIVVIGRKHMLKWPNLMDFFEANKIKFFMTNDNSLDDLFLLYATTTNPTAIFLTTDFLRDHLCLFEDRDRIAMERLIDTRQACVIPRDLRVIWPTPYEKIPSVDVAGEYFHIPVINANELKKLAHTDPPPPPHLNDNVTTWYCCKKD